MSDQPRDWDRELAEIDKAIARTPDAAPAPAGAGSRQLAGPVRGAPATGEPAGAPPAARGRERAATWAGTLLVLLLGGALLFWPYANACGLGLLLFGGAVAVLVLASLWIATTSWRRRQGFAHILSIAALLWGLGVAASIVLPRIGYA